MTKTKWIMKQYWRVGTIRVLLSLALGMFVLGRGYYIYIPALADLGIIGALILGSFLVLLFLGIGWLYDEKGKMWSPKLQAVAERNPYQYVTNFKSLTYDYQAFYGIIATMRKVLRKTGIDSTPIDDLSEHLGTFFDRKIRRADIFGAEPEALVFNRKHTFLKGQDFQKKKVPISYRLKLGFETELLRLNWIQSLTGLFQDVLVFGALYVTILFPEQVTNGLVPIDYLILGILFLSMPLFLGLIAAGWYYDKKMRVWSADFIVKFERNPYMYVPDPRNGVMEIPFFLILLKTLSAIFEKQTLDRKELQTMIQYLETYQQFDASVDQNMEDARALRSNLDVKF
ncbi:MAG: hypothetical protein RTV72_04065 [Candidatus Thorarchaeota archaeon]